MEIVRYPNQDVHVRYLWRDVDIFGISQAIGFLYIHQAI